MWEEGYKIRENIMDKKGELSEEIDKKILEKENEIAKRYCKSQHTNKDDE